MEQSTNKKRTRQSNNPPPALAREYLESLGYQIAKVGLQNKWKNLKILPVQRAHDGSPADFCFCCDMTEAVGTVLPHPFSHYQETLNVDEG